MVLLIIRRQHGSVAVSPQFRLRQVWFPAQLCQSKHGLGKFHPPSAFWFPHLFRERREPNNSRNFYTYSLSPFLLPLFPSFSSLSSQGRKGHNYLWGYTHHSSVSPSPLPAPQSLCQTEWSESEKDKNHMIALTCGISKKVGGANRVYKWTYPQNRNRVTDVEDKFTVTRG